MFHVCLLSAAILDDQSACGRGERLALALAREKVNGLMEGSSQSRVEVVVYELKNDSQYSTTDTSESQQQSLMKPCGALGQAWTRPGPGCCPAGPHNSTCPLLVCQILPMGVVSVIGPASSPASSSAVSHICGEKEVSLVAGSCPQQDGWTFSFLSPSSDPSREGGSGGDAQAAVPALRLSDAAP